VSEFPSLNCSNAAQQRKLPQLPFPLSADWKEQRCLWTSESCSATRESPLRLWHKPKVHYRAHKSLPLDPTLSQINVFTYTSLKFILILSPDERLYLPNGFFLAGFLTKIMHACYISRQSSLIWPTLALWSSTLQSPPFCYKISLCLNYIPQHLVLTQLHLSFLGTRNKFLRK
jgi:hypothetical protein